MPPVRELLQGEFVRTLDERFRVSIPQELVDALAPKDGRCVLVKERAGCLSLWTAATWQTRTAASVDVLKAKMRAGKLDEQLAEAQALGRLLSTRHKEVQLAGRGRLLLPEGFREFLGVAVNGELMIIGAAVCVEIWNPPAWRAYLEAQLPEFQRLFDRLSG